MPEPLQILQAFKSHEKLTDDQLAELGSFLEAEGGIKEAAEKYGLSEKEYRRLKTALGRKKVRVSKAPTKPEDEVSRVRLDKEREWVKKVAEQMWGLGSSTIMRWYSRAGELGYVDEKGEVDVGRLVNEAMDFYLAEGARVKEIERENVALKSAIDDYLKPRFQELVDLLADIRMRVLMIEQLNQDVEGLSLLLSPLKNRLGLT
jgi:hypothetical protein